MAIIKGNFQKNTLNGTTTNDSIFGYGDDDILNGNNGADRLDGGLGLDAMTGGNGNDTYVVDNIGDTTVEEINAGNDTVESSISWSLAANVENLVLTGSASIDGNGNDSGNRIRGNSGNNNLSGGKGNDRLSGEAGDDKLFGGEGNDLLNGGIGKNELTGGLGSDTYIVDKKTNTLIEFANQGIDTVLSSITWTLAENFENLELTQSAAINGTGNAGKNKLIGNFSNNILLGLGNNDLISGGEGDDILDGGLGDDKMDGGLGNDTYYVDSPGDIAAESDQLLLGSGVDTVYAPINWTLGQKIENLILTGNTAVEGIGNTENNNITGNSADNRLTGHGGNDKLIDYIGNDILDGGEGHDILSGGIGMDTLLGGSGNDMLRFINFAGQTTGGLYSGDIADGGTGALDTLYVTGRNQTLNLIRENNILNVEIIKFNDDSKNTLILDAQSVMDLSGDSDTLRIEAKGDNTVSIGAGWMDGGIVNGYQIYTQNGARLEINAQIGYIDTSANKFTISDAASAAKVSSVFTSGVDEITINFSGKDYKDWGLSSIDLSGFGEEDKLILSQKDGSSDLGTAKYTDKDGVFITEANKTSFTDQNNFVYRITRTDQVSWDKDAGKATLKSKQFKSTTHMDGYTTYVTNRYTSITSLGGKNIYSTRQTSYIGYTTHYTSKKSGQVTLTGLPPTLAESQFVFV